MPISVVFDPPLPSDSPSTFNTKAFTLLGDLNDWSTQANALPGEVATNLTTLLAAPPAIGSTTPAAVSATTLSASGVTTLSGGTIVNNGSGIVNPGALQGSMFHHANYLQFAGGTTGTAFNNHANTVANLTIADAGAVTIPGSLGVGVTPSASIGGGRELTVYGGVSIRGDSRYWYIDGKSGQDAMVIGLRVSGDTVDTDAININSAGAVTIPGSLSLTGGTFGYGTGAGGTVTQATSKSTAVTLNKPSGQITMNNAALAAGDVALFQVTNSVAVTSSIVLVSPNVNPAGEFYSVWSSHTFAGGFFVCVKNITAGSRSEALVINFAVLSGATS